MKKGKFPIPDAEPVQVVRDDTGRTVLVHPMFLRVIGPGWVKITLPGREGTGRLVNEDPRPRAN